MYHLVNPCIRHSLRALHIALAVVALGAATPAHAAVSFTRIAHSDDAVFADLRSSQPAFPEFGFAAPSINVKGEVAFLAGAIDRSDGDIGLFRGDGSAAPQALLRSDGNLDDPDNAIGFISSSAVPLALDGDIVFGASLKSGGTGIFRYDATSATTSAVATDRFVAPGGGFAVGLYDSIALRPAMNAAGEVVFAGVYGGGGTAGIFRGGDPLADRVIDTTQTGRLASFWHDPAISSNGLVGAVSNNFDPAGPSFWNEIVRLLPGAGVTENVLGSTLAGPPDSIQRPTLDIDHNSRAVYLGRAAALAPSEPDLQILLASPSAPAQSIADAKFSGGNFPFRSFDSEVALSEANTVAFVARNLAGQQQLLTHQVGRTTASQGKVYAEVLHTGQTIDGRVVDRIAFSREGANDRGEFVFVAEFSDGSSGVYKANFGSTAPGVIPQPGLRSEAETRRYDFFTHAETLHDEVDLGPAPGRVVASVTDGDSGGARADTLNDATGSHLKAYAQASSTLNPGATGGSASEGEARALSSVITNWVLPNPHPGNGQQGETIQMMVLVDGSLEYARAPGGVAFATQGTGRLSAPGAVGRIANGPVLPPNVPLVAEVNYIVNANVGGATFNAFGGYASLRNGTLNIAGDWDPAAWTLTPTADSLNAAIDTFVVVEYDVRYDETFALEFVVETFAGAHFFGTGTAIADFGNTARFNLRSLSGAPLVQLDSTGAALVPLPPALVLLLPGCALLISRLRPAPRDLRREARAWR